ncbi:MAG: undecaprenyldiphospho-muramoylpentapeptide beta-N-acetylglucosaminyltransferase [Defluviitaleaceae bacterium]|nr:undecaprenyldiphospho-muramoylpentapeptide beta-N-acetylglucosaminyltransferase [Defluviitaleaceae bacterium]
MDKKKNKRIVLTGGGTAGHVTPNIALLPALKRKGYDIHYIGSYTGIERGLIGLCGIPYYSISSGKLRRYFDLKNATDVFRIVKGLGDALTLLRRIKPNIVFSKGGFVVVPVVVAAKMLNIPVVIHESDITPGLANKLAMPFAKVVCTSFPETPDYVPKGIGVLTGSPIRASLLEGNAKKGLKICGFESLATKPILMIMGGSQGAVAINRNVFGALPRLLDQFHIIHLCGKGNANVAAQPGYASFEYVQEELPHLLAAADIVLSRAGSNTLFELLALSKPNLLIPLSLSASRGDQILNAASFERQGYSKVLKEDDLTENSLLESLTALYNEKDEYIKRMRINQQKDGVKKVIAEIERHVNH